MNYIKHLTGFFAKVSPDLDFNPTHISLYMALFQIWNQNRFENPICISREEIMRISKISSYSTYHKCIRDLVEKEYIVYNPSFNPYKGTTIEMVNLDFYIKPISKKEAKRLSASLKNEQAIEQVDEQVVEPVLYRHCTSSVQVYNIDNINNTNSTNSTNILNLGEEQTQKINDENDLSVSKKENDVKEIPQQSDEVKPAEKNEISKSVIPNDSERPLPDLDEVKNFFLENNFPVLEAEKFFNYYSSNGWLVGGKTKMKNWKAAARNWMLNYQKFQKNNTAPQPNHLQTQNLKNYAEPL